MKYVIVIVFVGALLAGLWWSGVLDRFTANEPSFAGDPAVLQCPGEEMVSVRYTTEADQAEVTADGETYVLTRVVSASGARYTNGQGVALWDYQGEVLVSLPEAAEAMTCQAVTETGDDEGGIDTTTATSTLTATSSTPLLITNPVAGASVASPVKLEGEVRGTWLFEATAPVVVVNWDGLIIGEGYIEATEDWMTEALVPFTGSVTYNQPADSYSASGTVIFQKANPSGLPANDAAVEVPVMLTPTNEISSSDRSVSSETVVCTPEQQVADVCTEEYAPVCGLQRVECVTLYRRPTVTVARRVLLIA